MQDSQPDHLAEARSWVAALAAGECTEGEFLTHVLVLEGSDPDVAWEVLALLDQLHRRRQLNDAAFRSVKQRLQRECLGYGGTAPVRSADAMPASRPKLRVEDASIAPARTPTFNLQPDDLLRDRYRVLQVQQQQPGILLIKAVDKVRSHLPPEQQYVAIQLFDTAVPTDPDLLRRVYRLQSLAHPAIARVFDVDEDDGRLFFTMEWCNTTALQQILGSNGAMALGLPAAHSILSALASALNHAHAYDLPHGQVNLANVCVTSTGDVRLQGFVMQASLSVATVWGDCLAFAELAHQMLSRCRAPRMAPVASLTGRGVGAQRPPGLTGKQWRLMDGALRGNDSVAASRLMASFADLQPAAVNAPRTDVGEGVRLRRGLSLQWPRRGLQNAAALAFVLMAGVGGYLLLQHGEARPMSTPGTEAVAAAAIQTRAADAPDAAGNLAGVAVTPVIVDARGRDVLDLARVRVRVDGDQPVAKIWVRRRGSLRGPVTFFWWTETGTADSARDFTQIIRRWEVIEDGAAGIELQVPVRGDPSWTGPRTFYVKIDSAGRGALLGSRTLAQVEIVPPRIEAMPRIEAIAANTSFTLQ